MLINCMLQRMIDGDLCFAFAVVIVPQHEGWTPEHKPMIFFPSSPMPLSLNNSICIHQSCICHSWYVLSGSLPRMLCFIYFDSPHSVQVSRDQSTHGEVRMMVFHSACSKNVLLLHFAQLNVLHRIYQRPNL